MPGSCTSRSRTSRLVKGVSILQTMPKDVLTTVGKLGQTSPWVLVDMLSVLEQDLRDVLHRNGRVLREQCQLAVQTWIARELTFLPSPAMRSNLSQAMRNHPVGKTHSGPWWYCKGISTVNIRSRGNSRSNPLPRPDRSSRSSCRSHRGTASRQGRASSYPVDL